MFGRLIDWIVGKDKPEPTLMQDGVWLMMGWKDMQDDEKNAHILPLIWLVAIVLLIPVMAFANTNTIDVPVPTHRIKSGTLLKAEDFELKTVNANLSHTFLVNLEDLVGKETRRFIRAGQPVHERAVRIPPDVRKNTFVQIIYQIPGISLSAKGRALEDARIGEAVKIQNIDSHKVVIGMVLANGTVKIQ